MKILITAPSLNEDENVSGIASLVRGIIARGKNEYSHFTAGRKDREGFGVKWYFRQAFLPINYRRAVKRASPDIVHLNTSFEPRSIVRDSVLTMATPKEIPVVLHIHGGRFVLQDYPSAVLASRANQMLRAARKVIVLSEGEKQSLLQRVPDLDIDVMANAIDVDEIPFNERTETVRTILYFGRIDMPKGLVEIIESCRRLAPDHSFKFRCCGTGPAESFFIKGMQEILGDRFEYRGVVKGAEKWSVLSSSDIFLLPSRFEGLPIALLEAMAAGCIPVVTDVGAMAEAVEEGVSGFVVEPGSVDQIVDKLQRLLSSGETQLAKMRKHARAAIEARHDMAGYVSRFEEIYDDLAGEK